MALWIFHNNFQKAEIPKDRLDRFAKERGLKPQEGLDHFRKLHHSESDNQSVTFIHRSMMEYFVADAIARQLCPERGGPADNPSEAIYKISGMLYWRRIDSGECAEYLSKMLEAGFGKLGEGEKEEVYRKWELAVFEQLEAGVPFQRIPEKIECSFAIRLQAEKIYCYNLIWVLRNLRDICAISKKIGSYAREQMDKNRYCTVLPLYIRLYSPNPHVWHLSNCDLMDANLCDAHLRGAVLHKADLRSAVLHKADLRSALLPEADLSSSNLRSADLSQAGLHKARLRSADLTYANFRKAHLSDARLIDAHLPHAVLCGADLCRADLRGTELNSADLSGAYLRSADLRGADLRGADLRNADLDNAVLEKNYALSAIKKLRFAKFDSIRIWDNRTITPYTRSEFFAIYDK